MVEKEDIIKSLDKALTERSNDGISKSYSHKPHLASLPYDHNTNDIDKLTERKDELNNRMSTVKDDLKDLNKSKNFYEKEVENNSKFILKLSDDIDTHLLNVFKDYFGDPTTDKPQKVIHDVRVGLNDSKQADAMEKFMDDINQFHKEYTDFHKDLNSLLDKKSTPDELHELFKSFNKQYNEFFNKYYDYHKEYGSGGFLDEGSASHEMKIISGFFERSPHGYENLYGYKNTFNRLTEINDSISKQNKILTDYENELKRTEDHIQRVKNN